MRQLNLVNDRENGRFSMLKTTLWNRQELLLCHFLLRDKSCSSIVCFNLCLMKIMNVIHKSSTPETGQNVNHSLKLHSRLHHNRKGTI